MIFVLLENVLDQLFVLFRDLADLVLHLHYFDRFIPSLNPLGTFLFVFALVIQFHTVLRSLIGSVSACI